MIWQGSPGSTKHMLAAIASPTSLHLPSSSRGWLADFRRAFLAGALARVARLGPWCCGILLAAKKRGGGGQGKILDTRLQISTSIFFLGLLLSLSVWCSLLILYKATNACGWIAPFPRFWRHSTGQDRIKPPGSRWIALGSHLDSATGTHPPEAPRTHDLAS